MKTASWVIVDIKTGESVLETFSEKLAKSVNTESYKVVTSLEWLQSINKKLKEDQKK